MNTIYILTEGEYSDYHILATFSTRELAEEVQKHWPGSDIEECELDALKIPEHPPGYTAWGQIIKPKTNTIAWSHLFNILKYGFVPKEYYNDGARPWYGFSESTFVVDCWARDKEHAEKIALDKFYQWKWEKEIEVTL